jgi:hypothetical protein
LSKAKETKPRPFDFFPASVRVVLTELGEHRQMRTDSLSLGIEFKPDENQIRLLNPSPPSFLDMVVLRDLRPAEGFVDFAVYRHGQQISLEILSNESRAEVSIMYQQTF